MLVLMTIWFVSGFLVSLLSIRNTDVKKLLKVITKQNKKNDKEQRQKGSYPHVDEAKSTYSSVGTAVFRPC